MLRVLETSRSRSEGLYLGLMKLCGIDGRLGSIDGSGEQHMEEPKWDGIPVFRPRTYNALV
jgi:hypothetical protein